MEEDQSIVFGTLNGRYDRHMKQKKKERKNNTQVGRRDRSRGHLIFVLCSSL